MHWVDRGPEPQGLETVRSEYTPRWLEYYRQQIGSRPSDSRWRDFHDDLGRGFLDMCGYCEELCSGEVDHFRPKSGFPEKVYEWSNWVFACHSCNQSKRDRWPRGGYVHPCAKSASARPDKFFDFDTVTTEIMPKSGLSATRRNKAVRTIDDLGLNNIFHLKKRLGWRWVVSELLLMGESNPISGNSEILHRLSARSTELSSFTRTLLAELDYAVDP